MAEQLPGAHAIPVSNAPVLIDGLAGAEPWLCEPVPPSEIFAIRIGGLHDNDDETGDDDERDAGELGADEEAAELGAERSAYAVGQGDYDKDKNAQ
jgi:hypothetical protein